MVATLASLLLWLVVLYLLVLGAAALLRPGRALAFLFGFAQTRRANTVEALGRMAVGAAFIILDEPRSWEPWGAIMGLFLLLSGAALLLAPELHRRLAPRLVETVRGRMPLLGAGALLMAVALAVALAGGFTGDG